MKRILQLSPLLIIAVVYIPSLILRLFSHDDTYEPVNRATLSLLSSVWIIGCQAAWLWATGVGLSNKLNLYSNRGLLILKASLYIPIFYIILPTVTLLSVLIPINSWLPFLTFGFYNHLHILVLICFIYPIYFVAKSLTTLEYRKPVSFGEYIITFISILFFPIGIFFVQPRIKKVIRFNSTKLIND